VSEARHVNHIRNRWDGPIKRSAQMTNDKDQSLIEQFVIVWTKAWPYKNINHLNSIWNRQVQEYLKWPRCRCVNVLERNGNPPLQVSLLGVCLPQGVLGLWLATFLRVARGVDFARLLSTSKGKRAESDWEATVTLGCPRCLTEACTVSWRYLHDYDRTARLILVVKWRPLTVLHIYIA
jgi:hypothetical protein